LQAAIAAQDFADQSLLAEQKKFQYGASTPTLVLQASSNLTQAQSNVLASATNYEKSKVQLDLVTAETLKKLGIDIADAEAGQVKTVPKVPGVVPVKTQETVPQQLQEQQQKQQQEGTQPKPQPQPQQQQQPPTQPH
jgi:outer membrane protein TolC